MQAIRGSILSPGVGHPERLPFLDILRLIAAQVIVWHHLAHYGPLSDIAMGVLSGPIIGLDNYGAIAVQVFFVTGGFLCAQSLMRVRDWTPRATARQLGHRYWRLAWPYFFAVTLAIVANTLAGQQMDHPAIAAFPTLDQLFAHAFFLQAILGYEQLSAGIWYLAIDLQLFALCTVAMAASHWLIQRTRLANRLSPLWCTQCALGLLAVGAMYYFNRHPELDIWCIYYMGSYFLGMAVAWWLAGALPTSALVAICGVAASALVVDFRSRLAVALMTAITIAAVGKSNVSFSFGDQFWSPTRAARITYSLFLVHFPVCLLLNAYLSPSVEDQPWLAMAGMFLAYVISLLVAIAFYHLVEARDWWRLLPIGSSQDRDQPRLAVSR